MRITKYFFAVSYFLIFSFFGAVFIYGQKTLVSVKGIIEQIIIEDITVQYEYVLATENGKRYRLDAQHSLSEYANRRVTVTGTIDGNQLNVSKEIKTAEEKSVHLSPPPPTWGSRKVLVLLLNFIDNQTQPVSTEQVRSNIFTGANSANAYFREASYHRFNLTGIERSDGDVVGWLTIPFTSNNCNVSTDLTEGAHALARQSGYEPNNYNTVVYIFPTLCGGTGANGGVVGDSTVIGRAWFVSGHMNNVSTIVHELGHTLGLQHANEFICLSTDILACESAEYGDPFDRMGRTTLSFFFNNYYRLALGWLTGQTQVVTTSGDYTLLPASISTKGNQVLQIPLKFPDGRESPYNYFLEFRRPVSFDNAYPNSTYYSQPVYRGVSIRYAWSIPSGGPTNLIDTTPNTRRLDDQPLTVGNTFIDTTHGLTITTLSTNPFRGARVRIQLSR